MSTDSRRPERRLFLPREGLDDLVRLLRKQGYTVLGPTVVNQAISLQPMRAADQLPKGLRDEQDGGHYRLVPGDPALTFEYVVGPDGPKGHLFPSNLRLLAFHVEGDDFVLDEGFAAAAQARHSWACGRASWRPSACRTGFSAWTGPRPSAASRRPGTRRRGSRRCCWPSTAPGPAAPASAPRGAPARRPREGFDLALTELRNGFLVEVGSQRGAALANQLPLREPTAAEMELAELKLQRACEQMGRQLDTEGIKELLDAELEHPEWDDVARRCLSCGNCTMVCPTCFCSTVSDSTYLTGQQATRTRQWESCYTLQFTYTTTGPERNTIRGRYRHWLRHKLGTWWDQFGTSGCVGCGRCITWCPVGIDLTEEIARLRKESHAHRVRKAESVRRELTP